MSPRNYCSLIWLSEEGRSCKACTFVRLWFCNVLGEYCTVKDNLWLSHATLLALNTRPFFPAIQAVKILIMFLEYFPKDACVIKDRYDARKSDCQVIHPPLEDIRTHF